MVTRTILLGILTLFGSQLLGQGNIKLNGSSANNLALPHSHFGWAVSTYGDFAAISAPNEDCNSVVSSGAVYIYKLNSGGWKLFQKLIPSDTSMMKLFGTSLKLYKSTLLVGAPNDMGLSGSVYIYKFNGSVWMEDQKLTPEKSVPYQMFGNALDIGAGYALIGSVSSGLTGRASGLVYMYTITPGKWKEETILSSPDFNENDLFGASITIVRDDMFLISAPRGHGSVSNSGVVYPFEKTNNTWIAGKKIYSPNGKTNGLFGCATSYSKNRLLIGAMQEIADTLNSGAAYIFKLEKSNTWTFKHRVTAASPRNQDYFGMSVLMHNETAIIGSPKWETGRQNSDIGCVDIYNVSDSTMVFNSKIIPIDGEDDDHYGISVSAFENELLIGSRLDDDLAFNCGSVYSYKMNECITNLKKDFSATATTVVLRNSPNPFSYETTIYYNLPEQSLVTLSVFDMLGKEVKTLVNHKNEMAGYHQVVWNGENNFKKRVLPGLYIGRIETNKFSSSLQMIYVK